MKCFFALEKAPDYVASRWLSRPTCFSADILSLIAICPAQFGGLGQSSDRESRQAPEFRKNFLFLPNLKMNRNTIARCKWLVQLVLWGKEEIQRRKN